MKVCSWKVGQKSKKEEVLQRKTKFESTYLGRDEKETQICMLFEDYFLITNIHESYDQKGDVMLLVGSDNMIVQEFHLFQGKFHFEPNLVKLYVYQVNLNNRSFLKEWWRTSARSAKIIIL